MSLDILTVYEMFVDGMTVDEKSVHEMTAYELFTVVEMSVDGITKDKMSINGMTVDEMTVDEKLWMKWL
jgi:hypothetical protein